MKKLAIVFVLLTCAWSAPQAANRKIRDPFEQRFSLLAMAFPDTRTGGASGAAFTGGPITSPITAADGTACTAPTYSFTNNTNTGMSNSAAALSFCSSGTQVAKFSTSAIDFGGVNFGGGTALGSLSAIFQVRSTGILTIRDGSATAGLNGIGLFFANEGVTGTLANGLVKLSTASPSTAIKSSAGDTTGVVGIATDGAGITSVVTVASWGVVNCVFDGATTAGNFVQISGTVAGNCHDSGAATFPAANEVIGRVLSTNAGTGTFKVFLQIQR